MREGTVFTAFVGRLIKMKAAKLVASALRVMGEVAVARVPPDVSVMKLS
jgi:hypothetical protein